MNGSKPWYHDPSEKISRAERYIAAWKRFMAETKVLTTGDFRAYDHEWLNVFQASLYKLIFESNRIEKAGLNEGDTKKLLMERIADKQNGKAKTEPKTSFQFGKHRRSVQEVVQHFDAIEHSTDLLMAFRQGMIAYNGSLSKTGSERRPPFITESAVKKMHSLMADGLIGSEWGDLKAGEYRDGPCMAGEDHVYLSHKNIPEAMKQWVKGANASMRSHENPIVKASLISYGFVTIHPFPDFNGRISRIIMNMVLRSSEVPFFAVLQGNAKGKHRYLTALKHADRGNIEPYACLIAIAVNEGFEQLNRNLEAAGLDPVRPKD